MINKYVNNNSIKYHRGNYTIPITIPLDPSELARDETGLVISPVFNLNPIRQDLFSSLPSDCFSADLFLKKQFSTEFLPRLSSNNITIEQNCLVLKSSYDEEVGLSAGAELSYNEGVKYGLIESKILLPQSMKSVFYFYGLGLKCPYGYHESYIIKVKNGKITVKDEYYDRHHEDNWMNVVETNVNIDITVPHIFGLLWTRDILVYYVDDKIIQTIQTHKGDVGGLTSLREPLYFNFHLHNHSDNDKAKIEWFRIYNIT